MPIPERHVVEITQYVAFSDWLLSLSNMQFSPKGITKFPKQWMMWQKGKEHENSDSGIGFAPLVKLFTFPGPWFAHLWNEDNINT